MALLEARTFGAHSAGATPINFTLLRHCRVSIELQKHKWKFGRTRNALGTRATGEYFRSFFEFSQTFTSVSVTRQNHGEHVFCFFQKTRRREQGKQLVNFDYQIANSLCSHHHYINRSCQFCVSIEFYRNTIFNQSAKVFSQDCFLTFNKQILCCRASVQ